MYEQTTKIIYFVKTHPIGFQSVVEDELFVFYQ